LQECGAQVTLSELHARHLTSDVVAVSACRKAAEVRKARKGQKRNLALLSFGEDAEQEEAAAAAPAKIK
jgi:hypothetical protein